MTNRATPCSGLGKVTCWCQADEIQLVRVQAVGDLESRIARGRGLASVRPIPSSDGQAACTRRASAELVEFRLGPQVVSAGMPAEINYHRFVVGWKHAVNGIPPR